MTLKKFDKSNNFWEWKRKIWTEGRVSRQKLLPYQEESRIGFLFLSKPSTGCNVCEMSLQSQQKNYMKMAAQLYI